MGGAGVHGAGLGNTSVDIAGVSGVGVGNLSARDPGVGVPHVDGAGAGMPVWAIRA